MLSTKNESVERVVHASPEAIFAVLADPSRHQEIDGSGSLRGGPASTTLALGDEFGMDMQIGAKYSMTNTVVEFEPGRRIAWQARSSFDAVKKLIGGRIWRYELTPVEGGTLVRETWDISQEAIPLLVSPLRSMTRRNMTKTLERLEKVVA